MVVCECCLCRTGYKVQGHNSPLPLKDLGNAPAHSPLLRRIKGLIAIHGSGPLTLHKLLHLWAALQDKGKKEKKKLPLHAGNSHLDTAWS